MRRLAGASLGLSLVLSAGSLRADVGDAVAEAAARIAIEMAVRMTFELLAYSIERPISERYPLPELAEWKDPATNSTSRMTKRCGALVETSLTGSTEQNFLNVVLVNESARALELAPAFVRFSNGVRELLHHEPLRVTAAGRAAAALPFPRKQDFAGQKWLEVTFAVNGSCWFSVRHEHDPGAPSDPDSYLEYSDLELWFGAGLRFDASGGLSRLGRDDGVATELGLTRYLAAHHGYSLELLSETDGSAAPAFQVQSLGFAAGYVVRLYPLSWLSLTYGPALGAVSYVFDGSSRDQTWALVFQQRLRLQARLFTFPEFGAIHLAPSLVHQIVADGELAGVGLRGSTAAALLSLGIGL